MATNLTALEKKLARNEAAKLRRAFRREIKNSTNTITGLAAKSTVRTRFKRGRLDRLTFVAPQYVFIQHNGFEGKKSNGVTQRLKATNVVNKAVTKSKVLNSLIDGITNIRAEEVTARITF